jgi:hypothetical protein
MLAAIIGSNEEVVLLLLVGWLNALKKGIENSCQAQKYVGTGTLHPTGYSFSKFQFLYLLRIMVYT